jgi:glycosyl transferase family 1
VARARVKTVYFTTVPLFPSNNGGALACRNQIRRLAHDPAVDLLVCSTGSPVDEVANRRAVELLGADYVFLPYRGSCGGVRARPQLSRSIARRWPFLFEAEALNQPQIDTAFMDQVRAAGADAVIVEYVPSASYVRSVYSAPVRRITVTLNRETDFYRQLRQTGRLPPDASTSWIAVARVSRFERWVYRKSDAAVALSSGDLPTWRGRPQRREVMPPVFDPSPFRWRHTGARTLFFVGNIGHYPNLHAIESLSTRLSPELESIDSGVEIRILGATRDSVPRNWQRPNLVFLGDGDDATLADEFVTAGLFIAPVANPFGSKIKLLDCLAHATPFVASGEALTGLPFLSAVPRIELEQPRAAAELIVGLLSSNDTLEQLSQRLSHERDDFIELQRGAWGRLLRSVTS